MTEKILDVLVNKAPVLLLEHFLIVVAALALTVLIAVPLGIVLTRKRMKNYVNGIMAFLNIAQSVPSLAVVALGISLMGVGLRPALVVLVIYGMLPVVRNTIAGIEDIDDDILEAARGMGMNAFTVLRKVEVPLAFPIIMNGIQTTAIILVATATIAALIGAGGLGSLVFIGIQLMRPEQTIVGAGLTALMSIGFDRSLGYVNKRVTGDYRA